MGNTQGDKPRSGVGSAELTDVPQVPHGGYEGRSNEAGGQLVRGFERAGPCGFWIVVAIVGWDLIA